MQNTKEGVSSVAQLMPDLSLTPVGWNQHNVQLAQSASGFGDRIYWIQETAASSALTEGQVRGLQVLAVFYVCLG